jgi:hypothetical protein
MFNALLISLFFKHFERDKALLFLNSIFLIPFFLSLFPRILNIYDLFFEFDLCPLPVLIFILPYLKGEFSGFTIFIIILEESLFTEEFENHFV